MKEVRGISYFLPLLVGLFVFSSCATTNITTAWRDPAFQGPVKKILVMGISQKPAIQRFAEDEFVSQLRERGTAAVAGYSVLPYGGRMGQRLVAAKAREIGADAVLVIRPVGEKTTRTYVPGQVYGVPGPYRRWGSYYGFAYTPGYVAENQYVYIETNLFDIDTDKLIWSAESETALSANNQQLIKSFIDTIVTKMASAKLIR